MPTRGADGGGGGGRAVEGARARAWRSERRGGEGVGDAFRKNVGLEIVQLIPSNPLIWREGGAIS